MIQSNLDQSNDDPYEDHKEHFAQMSMEEIRKELDGIAGMMGLFAKAAQEEDSKENNFIAGAICDLSTIVSILAEKIQKQ